MYTEILGFDTSNCNNYTKYTAIYQFNKLNFFLNRINPKNDRKGSKSQVP